MSTTPSDRGLNSGDDAKVTAPLPGHAPTTERETLPLPGALPNDAKATLPLGGDTTESPTPSVPQRIGRFEVRSWLGSGAFGDVYRAHDPQLDREVALKVAKPGSLDTPERVARFLREAKSAANLRHPNIVPLYETGRDGDRLFIATAFIAGRTLEAVLQEANDNRTPLSLDTAARIVRKLADALAYAHGHGIVHRDVKPANVMVDETGEPMLLDFGLAARAEAGDERLTQDGQGMGTPAYMAPEQADGHGVAASDQYSLGCTLYELVTGQTPFSGGPGQQMFLHKTQPVPAPRSVRPGVPRDLDTVILKCLEKEQPRRYGSCSELREDLRRFLDREPVRARRIGPVERVVRWAKRNPVVAGSLVFAALTLLAGTGISLWQMGRAMAAERAAIAETEEKDRQKRAADEQRDLARRNEQQAREERERAEQQKANAFAVRDFMKTRLIRQANPWVALSGKGAKGGARDVTLRQTLDSAAKEFDPAVIHLRFPGQPLLQAEVLEMIAETFEGLNEHERSLAFMSAAVGIREKHLGRLHEDTLGAKTSLVFSRLAASQVVPAMKEMLDLGTRLEESMAALPEDPAQLRAHPALKGVDAILDRIGQRANPYRYIYATAQLGLNDLTWLAVQVPGAIARVDQMAARAARLFGPDDKRTYILELWGAFCQNVIGKTKEATAAYEKILARAERTLPPDDRLLDGLREVLVMGYMSLDTNHERVIELLTKAYDARVKELSPTHPASLLAGRKLASALRDRKELPKAIAMMEKIVEATEQAHGPDAQDTLIARSELADIHLSAKNYDKAIAHYEHVVTRWRLLLGPTHADTLQAIHDLAYTYGEAGKYDLAVTLNEEALRGRTSTLGPNHSETLKTLNNLAFYVKDGKNPEKAVPLFEELLRRRTAISTPDDPETLSAAYDLAVAYIKVRDRQKALPLLEDTLKRRTAVLGENDLATLNTGYELAYLYSQLGRREKAIPLYERVLAGELVARGADSEDTLVTRFNLGHAYRAEGEVERAIPQYEEVYRKRLANLGERDQRTQSALRSLENAYTEARQFEKAIPLLEDRLAAIRKNSGTDPFAVRSVLSSLSRIYAAAGQPDKATALFEQQLARVKEQYGPDDNRTRSAESDLIQSYYENRQLEKVVPIYKQRLAQVRTKQGPDHRETLSAVINLAGAYSQAKQYDEAVKLLTETRDRCKDSKTVDEGTKYNLLSSLASAHRAAGQPEKAITLYQERLAELTAKNGPTHSSTRSATDQLARAFVEAGQADKGIELQKQRVAATKAKYGPTHTESLSALSALAGTYRDARRFDDVVAVNKEIYESRASTIGIGHQLTQSAGHSLAYAYRDAGRPDKAVEVYEDRLSRVKERFGDTDQNTRSATDDLTRAYRQYGQPAKAVPIYRERVAVLRAQTRPDTQAMMDALRYLADVHTEADQFDAAVSVLEERVKFARERYMDPRTANEPLRALAAAYGRAGQGAKAESTFKEYIETQRSRYDGNSTGFSYLNQSIARELIAFRRYAAAEALTRDALAVYLQRDAASFERYDCESLLGEVLFLQKKYAEAEPVLVSSYENFMKRDRRFTSIISGWGHGIPAALDRLVNFYAATGKPEQEKKYRALRANYPYERAPAPREPKP